MTTFETSDSIKAIGKALLDFQMTVGKIDKDSKNPFFDSKYASLSHILEKIGAPMQETGLVVSQFPTGDNGLTTILMHPESGEWMRSYCEIKPIPEYHTEKDQNKKVVWRSEHPYVSPQSIGSAITYSRRYAIGSILCLNIDDDDDGNAASEPTKGRATNGQSNGQPKAKENDDRPWLTEQLFEQAKARIQKGEIGVFEKTNAAFKMKREYKHALIELEKQLQLP